jgi:hypothetical protein
MLRLENDDWRLLAIGSSNFTTAGLGIVPGRANLEANLVYKVKRTERGFKAIREVWPQLGNELSLDSKSLIWNADPEAMEDGGDTPPLPACFREAIFVPGENPSLEISLVAPMPTSWSISGGEAGALLSSASGDGVGEYKHPLRAEEVFFVLNVAWESADGDALAASWPVNVSNPTALPSIAELKGLTLEELLDILASSRPLHDAATRILRRRRRKKSPSDIQLDPLRRLESAALLLRRTKRVAAALDRLKERLERPALTRDAFEWRLRGPIGSATLAEAFVREATLPGEASFYLAELALTLSRVNPDRSAEGGINRHVVSELLTQAIGELANKARDLPTVTETKPLDRYVAQAFRRAAPV